MILVLALTFLLVPVTMAVSINVRRGEKSDIIFWRGDCRKLKAERTMLGEEKACICSKRINVDGRTLVLDRTFYQNMDVSPTCLYNFREIGQILIYFNHLDSEVVLNNAYIASKCSKGKFFPFFCEK